MRLDTRKLVAFPPGSAGSRALISRSEAVVPGNVGLTHYLINLIVASIWLYYAWSKFALWRGSDAPLHLMLLLRNSAVTLLFLCRRPAKMATASLKEWVIALVGTFIGYFYGAGVMVLPGVHTALVYLAGLLGFVAILALGRSFGIVPANRGIVTRGPYAIVRHPIYFSYVLFDIGYLLGALALHNILVFSGVVLVLYLRAIYEERVLRMDSAYREYARRTPYMFIPGVV